MNLKTSKYNDVVNIKENAIPNCNGFMLKRRPLWHKAKKCHLTPGQTELKVLTLYTTNIYKLLFDSISLMFNLYFKVDFPLPIVACNLMIEYSDFYENFQVMYSLWARKRRISRKNLIYKTLLDRVTPSLLVSIVHKHRPAISWSK